MLDQFIRGTVCSRSESFGDDLTNGSSNHFRCEGGNIETERFIGNLLFYELLKVMRFANISRHCPSCFTSSHHFVARYFTLYVLHIATINQWECWSRMISWHPLYILWMQRININNTGSVFFVRGNLCIIQRNSWMERMQAALDRSITRENYLHPYKWECIFGPSYRQGKRNHRDKTTNDSFTPRKS